MDLPGFDEREGKHDQYATAHHVSQHGTENACDRLGTSVAEVNEPGEEDSSSTGAPAGLRLSADPSLRRIDDGRTLLGGAGLRIVKLTQQGADVVSGWLAGAAVGDSSGERALARRMLDSGLVHPVTTPGDPAEITVVVPVHNDATALAGLLKRLEGLRIVVVDDGSDDEAAVRAAAERFGAGLLRRRHSSGPGPARNDGLAEVRTPLTAFVDADTECSADDLARLAGHFADRAVVAVAPRITSKPAPSLLARYETHYSPLDMGTVPASAGPGQPVPYVPSAVLVARTAALRDAGGFDPQLRYGEDVDLIWRLLAEGTTVRYEPEVAVAHLPRQTWAQWLRQRHDYGSAAAPLGRRHGAAVAPARCAPSSAAMWALLALRRPGDAAAAGARSLRPLLDSLQGVPDAHREALRLLLRGHLAAGRNLAEATGRVWWPLALGGALAVRRLRAPLAVALLACPVLEYVEGRRPTDPLRTVALRVIDRAAYGAGVWRSAIAERSARALLPDLAGNRVRRLEQSDPRTRRSSPGALP